MLDAISISMNVLGIAQACTNTIQSIDLILRRYYNAPTRLQSLISELRQIYAALVHIQALFYKNDPLANSLDANANLKNSMNGTLIGCLAVIKVLDKHIEVLDLPTAEMVDWTMRQPFISLDDAQIQDYITKSHAHLKGMSLIINCLQLDSAQEISEILQAPIFITIAQILLSIDAQNENLVHLSSIYDNVPLDNEEREFDFDDLVVTSKAYRDVLRVATRKISGFNGGASVLRRIHDSGASQLPSSIAGDLDGLTNVPSHSRSPPDIRLPPGPILPEGNLIDLNPLPPVALSGNSPSPHLNDLQEMSWSFQTAANGHEQHFPPPPTPSPPPMSTSDRDSSCYGIEPNELPRRGSVQTYTTSWTNRTRQTQQSPIMSQPYSANWRASDVPPIDEQRRLPDYSRYSDGDTDKIVITPARDDKILVEPEDSSRNLSAAGPSRSSVASSNLSHPSPGHSPSLSIRELQTFPSISEGGSPSRELASPIDAHIAFLGYRRPSGTDGLIPPPVHYEETRLLNEMDATVADNNATVQLGWAEEALSYVRICEDYERRASRTQKARTSVPESETRLKRQATDIVEHYIRQGRGRALFIKARLLERDPVIINQLFAAATRAGHFRAHYYLGLQSVKEKDKSMALHHFETGLRYNDSACQYIMGKFYYEGSLGWTRFSKDESKGRDLLFNAALTPDRDCPDVLHVSCTFSRV
jgi:hypothetical protein